MRCQSHTRLTWLRCTCAGTIRAMLYQNIDTKIAPYGATVKTITSAISRLRGSVGGGKDQGLVSPRDGGANIVPADGERQLST